MNFNVNLFNATLLGLSAIYAIIILISCVQKTNKTMMYRPFIAFCMTITLLLSCGFLEWISKQGTLFFKMLYVSDYTLCCLASTSFYYYIRTYTYALKHPEHPEMTKTDRKPCMFLLVYGLGISVLFLSSMWTGFFYYFDENGIDHYTNFYPLAYLLGCVGPVISLRLILKNRKIYEKDQFYLFLSYILGPSVLMLSEFMAHLVWGYVAMAFVMFVIYVRIHNAQAEHLLEEKNKVMQKEAEMAEVKMELMMSQIQPHFLYNTLSSIAYLCTEDPEEAELATTEFAGYLKSNLQSISVKHPVPFEAELAHTKQYLSIEKRRFQDRLHIVYDIQETRFKIPALTLQTLVENAVRYSVSSRYETSTVTISTEKADGEYLVKIIDDGPGFDVNVVPSDDRRHIGMAGARIRLEEMVKGYLEIDSDIGRGTKVTIHIPMEEE